MIGYTLQEVYDLLITERIFRNIAKEFCSVSSFSIESVNGKDVIFRVKDSWYSVYDLIQIKNKMIYPVENKLYRQIKRNEGINKRYVINVAGMKTNQKSYGIDD